MMQNDVYNMILRHKGKYIVYMDLQEQVYKARFMIFLWKNRIWHNILYWPELLEVYIKHRTTCTEWKRNMILHFRGSDYRRYLSSTWYDMMDWDFTKSKVGYNLQSWMHKTRICWWSDKMNSWKMLWWKNTRMMFGI